jgi:hypothetical protein
VGELESRGNERLRERDPLGDESWGKASGKAVSQKQSWSFQPAKEVDGLSTGQQSGHKDKNAAKPNDSKTKLSADSYQEKAAVAGRGLASGGAGGAPGPDRAKVPTTNFFGAEALQDSNGQVKDPGMPGHLVVVCDVVHPPSVAFARFEDWLRQRGLAGEVTATNPIAAKEGGFKSDLAEQYKGGIEREGKSQRSNKEDVAPGDSATRLYVVNISQAALAETLREAAALQPAEFAFSNLSMPGNLAYQFGGIQALADGEQGESERRLAEQEDAPPRGRAATSRPLAQPTARLKAALKPTAKEEAKEQAKEQLEQSQPPKNGALAPDGGKMNRRFRAGSTEVTDRAKGEKGGLSQERPMPPAAPGLSALEAPAASQPWKREADKTAANVSVIFVLRASEAGPSPAAASEAAK